LIIPCPDRSRSPAKLITEILELLIANINSEELLTVVVLEFATKLTAAKPINCAFITLGVPPAVWATVATPWSRRVAVLVAVVDSLLLLVLLVVLACEPLVLLTPLALAETLFDILVVVLPLLNEFD
jgi:hypothetical protein